MYPAFDIRARSSPERNPGTEGLSELMMTISCYYRLVSRRSLVSLSLPLLFLAGCPTVRAEIDLREDQRDAAAEGSSDSQAARQEAGVIDAATPPAKIVQLQPLGRELSAEAVSVVERGLSEFYGFQVVRAAPLSLPRSAYYPPRRRYRAEKLLRFLDRHASPRAFRVLGLTAVDISTTKGRYRDWGIMGLASLDGRVSVMSMFRCRRGSSSALHARERLGKVAVHEIGHTLGLEHCPTVGCLMEDARGTNTTTDREHLLCPRCRTRLQRRGLTLPPSPSPPWRPPGTHAGP